MTKWGRAIESRPGIVVDGKLVTTDLVEINLGIRILLGHSFYDDWEDQPMFVTKDPLGNPVDRRHPWNQHTNPQPQKRDFEGNYSWVMSSLVVRQALVYLALDTGGGPSADCWSRPALSGSGQHRPPQGDRDQRADPSSQDRPFGPGRSGMEGPAVVGNTIERDRARTYFQAYCRRGCARFH